MNATNLTNAILLDFAVGDPHWFPHPVRGIGWAISRGEKAARKVVKTPASEFIGGAVLTGAIVFAAYKFTESLIETATKINPKFGALTEIGLAWTTIAARSLLFESDKVLSALERGDIESARQNLSMIVGRDTENLSESEIARATIETLAESFCDGIAAPRARRRAARHGIQSR